MSHDNPNDRYSWASDIEATTEQREATQRSNQKSKAVVAMSVALVSAVGAIVAPDHMVKYLFLFVGLSVVVRMAAVKDGINIEL